MSSRRRKVAVSLWCSDSFYEQDMDCDRVWLIASSGVKVDMGCGLGEFYSKVRAGKVKARLLRRVV